MAVYIIKSRGPRSRKVWTPGDPGQPSHADSKPELLAFCPAPEPIQCPTAGCGNMCCSYPHSTYGRWQWLKLHRCRRCQELRNRHGLELAELVAMWEAQDRRCFRYPECPRMLPDPRIITATRGGGRDAQIDHDHRICPQKSHSCERCRRGLACVACNTHSLSIRTTGLWVLPEKTKDLRLWLEFLGPEDRHRLRDVLGSFPDQPARSAPRRRSHSETPSHLYAVPLFDLDADQAG